MANITFKIISHVAFATLLLFPILLIVSLAGANNAVTRTFIDMLFQYSLYMAVGLVILPSLLQKRWMFLTYFAALGLLLFSVWGREMYLENQESYKDGGAGAAFGYALFLLLTLSFVLGIGIRISVYAIIKFAKSGFLERLRAAPENRER